MDISLRRVFSRCSAGGLEQVVAVGSAVQDYGFHQVHVAGVHFHRLVPYSDSIGKQNTTVNGGASRQIKRNGFWFC